MQSVNRENNTIQKGVLTRIKDSIKKMFKRGSKSDFSKEIEKNITPSEYLDAYLAVKTIDEIEAVIKADNELVISTLEKLKLKEEKDKTANLIDFFESRKAYNSLILIEIEKRKEQEKEKTTNEAEKNDKNLKAKEEQIELKKKIRTSKFKLFILGDSIIPDLYESLCNSAKSSEFNEKDVKSKIFNLASNLKSYEDNMNLYVKSKESLEKITGEKEDQKDNSDISIKIDTGSILSNYEFFYNEVKKVEDAGLNLENTDKRSIFNSILINLENTMIRKNEKEKIEELKQKLKNKNVSVVESPTPEVVEPTAVVENSEPEVVEPTPIVEDKQKNPTSTIVIKGNGLKVKKTQKITKDPILKDVSLFTLKVTKNRLLIYYKRQFLDALKKYSYRVVLKSPEQLEISDEVDVKSWQNDQGIQGNSIDLKTLNKISELSIVDKENKEIYNYDLLSEQMVKDAHEKAMKK